jgi:DNA helicase-2/ATP-dependent DNA helicase PcrA
LAKDWQVQAESSPRMVQVFEDLQRLFGQMQDFETVALSPYLATYSAVFPRPPALEVSEPVGEASGVQLLTVHAAKGLEFETVYLIGCTQRTWSGGRSGGRTVPPELNTRADLPPDHEFRRLMYVAVTRAKRELVMSAPVATAAGSRQLVSPFISEMLGKDVSLLPVGGAGLPGKQVDLMNKLQRFYPLRSQIPSDRLPFETADGWLDLGVTALAGYEFCPFEFFIQHVLKISQPMGPQLGFGSILHKTFEAYYKTKLAGGAPELKELQLMLDEGWSNRGYATRAEAEHDLVLAHKTLQNWFEREQVAGRVIVGCEVPVRFEIGDAKLRLRGKIDALFERPEGFEIRDYKTGRTKYDTEKLAKAAKENFQLRSYATALEQLRGVYPAAVVLDYVVTGAEGEAVLTPAIMRNHRDKLAVLAERIRARDFAPNPSAMHQCAAITFYGTGEADEAAALGREGGAV